MRVDLNTKWAITLEGMEVLYPQGPESLEVIGIDQEVLMEIFLRDRSTRELVNLTGRTSSDVVGALGRLARRTLIETAPRRHLVPETEPVRSPTLSDVKSQLRHSMEFQSHPKEIGPGYESSSQFYEGEQN